MFLDKASHTIQLKIKNLEFHNKPEAKIKAAGNQTLICSAYGNVRKMSGKWVSIDGTNVSYVSYRNGNIFAIKAIVNKTGAYICTVRNQNEEIQSITRVNFFSCKFISSTFELKTLRAIFGEILHFVFENRAETISRPPKGK